MPAEDLEEGETSSIAERSIPSGDEKASPGKLAV